MSEASASTPWTLRVEGMHCAACVGRVERLVGKVAGVSSVSVSLATERASVVAPSDAATQEGIAAALERAGFHALFDPPEELDDAPAPPAPARRDREAQSAVVALVLAGLVMVLSMVPALHFPGHVWAQALLSGAVVFGAGRGYFVRAARGSLGMDLLVALGSGAAWALSFVQLFRLRNHSDAHLAHALYFETSAMIVALVLLGKLLEARARGKAGEALRALGALQPGKAVALRGGRWVKLPVARVLPGERVRVDPWERVPVDGALREGEALLDESWLTGESEPVLKRAGEALSAGALNGERPLELVATAVGAHTRLAAVVRLVEQVQSQKAPLQRLVERAAEVFAPAVVALCALGFVALWLGAGLGVERALVQAVTALVIACPCALGLATPVTVLVGTGRAAQLGILVRDLAALEQLARATDVVFDKTGTLTEGRPEVTRARWLEAGEEARGGALVRSLALRSAHPLSQALARYFEGEDELALTGLAVLPGKGTRAELEGRALRLGSPAWLGQEGTAVPEQEAQSQVMLAVDGRVVAVFSLMDRVREGSREAVQSLRARGMRVHLLSGDRDEVARRVARELGLDEALAHGGMSVEDKAEQLVEWTRAGRVVVMVGDGVNDGPALAAASVGVAMGSGSAVATGAAGLTLLHDDPRTLLRAMGLSARIRRTIVQNLAWALGYNLAAVPLALSGALSHFGGPMLAAAAMALSSLTVLGNALRLRRA